MPLRCCWRVNLILPHRRLASRQKWVFMPLTNAAAAMIPALSVKKVSAWPELEATGSQWNALAEQQSPPSYFVSCDWCSAWWQSFGERLELFVLLIRDQFGDLMGIAPLYCKEQ